MNPKLLENSETGKKITVIITAMPIYNADRQTA